MRKRLSILAPSNLCADRYNTLAGSLRSYAHRISLLPAQDPFHAKMEAALLSKLYDMGVLGSQSGGLSDVLDGGNKSKVRDFCFLAQSDGILTVLFLRLYRSQYQHSVDAGWQWSCV